jgi:hypothetical protein
MAGETLGSDAYRAKRCPQDRTISICSFNGRTFRDAELSMKVRLSFRADPITQRRSVATLTQQ